jgi:hypothetical protein
MCSFHQRFQACEANGSPTINGMTGNAEWMNLLDIYVIYTTPIVVTPQAFTANVSACGENPAKVAITTSNPYRCCYY